MPHEVQVPEPIREQLRLALIRLDDFRPAVEGAELSSVSKPPGCFHTRIQLAVPRPLDPEVAEMRELDVYLRPVEDGYEVFSIRGLNLEELGED